MIVRISSVFVPYTDCNEHIKRIQAEVLPAVQSADGFMSVWFVRRTLVGYSEFVLISLWRSEQAVARYEASIGEQVEGTGGVLRRSPPEIYNVLALEFRPTQDRDTPAQPEGKDGRD